MKSYEKHAAQRWEIIKNEIPEDSIGAELGVFKGSFSIYLLRKNLRKLYLVDPWYKLAPHWDYYDNDSTLDAFRDILDKFESEINNGIVEPVVDTSHNFLNSDLAEKLDWIYLDSSHSHLETCCELFAVTKLLKNNTIVLGDDFGKIKSAMSAYLMWCKYNKHNIELVELGSRQWKLTYSHEK